MKNLTKLERHIKAKALMAIRRMGEIKTDHEHGKGVYLFSCDGVFDELIYDFEKKKFVEIRYKKCIGEIISGPVKMTGYSDEVETITIPL